MKSRNIIKYGAVLLAAVWMCLCISRRLTVRDASLYEGDCMLYYIVNVDGMKGLGHSMVLLVDREGRGTALSFNGMQRSLAESLLGQRGVGKMSTGTMTAEETDAFLRTGDMHLSGDQLRDNYDMALYRPVTAEEYDAILECAEPYMAAGEQFAALYEKWAMEEDADKKAEYKETLERMGQDESLPLYQLYTNNCDHAARILIASVDPDMREYMNRTRCITPNGNLKAFGAGAKDWGVMMPGKQSLMEQMLMFLVIF